MSKPDTHDEHAGKGGSYVFDPSTGKRELQERSGYVKPASPQPSNKPQAVKPKLNKGSK